MGNPLLIRIYQQSLKFILEQRIGTLTQQKWITKLLGYSFVVEYKKGRENKATGLMNMIKIEEKHEESEALASMNMAENQELIQKVRDEINCLLL